MGIDIALGDLIGGLFFGAGDVAAADVGAAGLADVAGTAAADVGAADVAGLGAAAGAGSEVAASAAPAIAAGDVAGQIAAEGGLAADTGLAGAAGAGAAGLADAAATPAAELGAAGGGLGEGVDSALALADTGAPGAGAADTSLSFLSDPGAATTGISTPATAAPTGAAATPGAVEANLGAGGTITPSTELASGNPNLSALLSNAPATPPEPTPSSFAFTENPPPTGTQFADATVTDAGTAAAPELAAGSSSAGSDITASATQGGTLQAQIDAEGGLNPPAVANASSANAMEALNNAPATAGGGGVTDALGSALNSPYAKLAELGIPLGFLGYNLAKGPAPIPPQANMAQQNAINQLAPLQGKAAANVDLYNQTAAADLNMANNFQISPAQAAAIKTDSDNAKNQLYQQLANEGNTDPTKTTAWIEGNNQINQAALAQQVQMVNQLITTAFQAAGAATQGVGASSAVTSALDNTLMQAAQLQSQQDQAFQQATSSALQSFGLLAALSGKFGGSSTPATPAATP
jgi:hypothetical protein